MLEPKKCLRLLKLLRFIFSDCFYKNRQTSKQAWDAAVPVLFLLRLFNCNVKCTCVHYNEGFKATIYQDVQEDGSPSTEGAEGASSSSL